MTRLKNTYKKLSLTMFTITALGLLAWPVGKTLHGWIATQTVAAQVLAPAVPVAPWTAIGAGGTVDELSIPFFGFHNASAGYAVGTPSTNRLEFRYNVVNVQHYVSAAGAIPNITMPGWTTLEFGAQAPATSSATAYLYRVNRCTGQQTLVCWVTHTNQPAPGNCRICQFPNTTFNFASNLYYVRVLLSRNTPGEAPMAHTLRIY
jgi:hypothetical protein